MRSRLRVVQGINVVLCLLGTLICGGLLAYVTLAPQDFERRLQGFVVHEIEKEVGEKLSSPATSRLEDAAARLSHRLADRIDEAKGAIAAGIPQFIAAVVAAMCRSECDDRAELEAALVKVYQDKLARLNVGFATLRTMVEDKYKAKLAELRQDISIFLSSNLIAVTLALALALFRGEAARHLLPISAVLFTSTLVTSFWYIFEQNWVMTIIYSDYFGWSYLSFLGLVFLLLADIALNRARVATRIINGTVGGVGLVVPMGPC